MSIASLATVAGILFLISATGIGYAMHNESHSHGSLTLAWTGTPTTSTNQPQIVCTVSQTSTKLTVTITKLAPGGSCSVHGKLFNSGTLFGTLSSSSHVTEPSGCLQYAFSDNIAVHPAPTLSGGGTAAFVGTLTLVSGSGNACQGTSAGATDTITLSASCGDNDHDGDCDEED